MRTLRQIAFVAADFAAGGITRHLLDRFLIGYPRDGEFHRPADCQIVLYTPGGVPANELQARVQEFGLKLADRVEAATSSADAVVVVGRGTGDTADHGLIETALHAARPGSCCFVHGALANDAITARRFAALTKTRGISLCAGSSVGLTYRLPEVDVPAGASIRESVIVVQGNFPAAESEALEGLLPILERRGGGERGVQRIRLVSGDVVWQSSRSESWAWPLLGAALLRSNTVQGDPVKDGRTQDVLGLGLVPKLAKNPRCWFLEHTDGLKSAIFVLDGVVKDYNFAVRLATGETISAQLYRPPSPMLDQFSRLTAVMEDFFRSGEPPWGLSRSFLIASVLEAMRSPAVQDGSGKGVLVGQ